VCWGPAPKPPMSRLRTDVGDSGVHALGQGRWSGTRVVGPGPRAGHPRRDACQPQGKFRRGVLIGGRGPSRRSRSSFPSGTRRAGIASAGPGLPRARARDPPPRPPFRPDAWPRADPQRQVPSRRRFPPCSAVPRISLRSNESGLLVHFPPAVDGRSRSCCAYRGDVVGRGTRGRAASAICTPLRLMIPRPSAFKLASTVGGGRPPLAPAARTCLRCPSPAGDRGPGAEPLESEP
jgi:hypothetical protein